MKKAIFLITIIVSSINAISAQQEKKLNNSLSLGMGWSRAEGGNGLLLSLQYERQIARRWTAEISYLNNIQIEGLYEKVGNVNPPSMVYVRNSNDKNLSESYPYLDRVPKEELERGGMINNFNRFNTDYHHSLNFLLGYHLIKKEKHQLQLKSGILLSYANYSSSDEWGHSFFQPNDFEGERIPIIFDSRLMVRNFNFGFYVYNFDYQYFVKKNLSLGLRHAWLYHENTEIDALLTFQLSLSKKF